MKSKRNNQKLIALSMVVFLMGISGSAITAQNDQQINGGLSRVREGGTPYNPDQSLEPYAISMNQGKDAPTANDIVSPGEYDPMHGVLFCFSGSWNQVVTDMVVALTQDPAYDEIAYVLVANSYRESQASSMFSSNGADMSKVEFIIQPHDSIWIRDYGPHFIWQNNTLGIVDSHYYPSRDDDNFIPTLIGDEYFQVPTYDMGLYYSGGNFIPGPEKSAFVTELVNNDNDASGGFNETFIAELYHQYQGIETLHIMPQLPSSVDGTGHIDMWMNIVDEDTVIISEFQPGSNPTAIQITNDAVPYMEALGFEVFRTPAWNVGSTHYTYTNAFRVNDRYFIPSYSSGNSGYQDEDNDAYAAFEAAAGPNVEIIQIDCYDIIPAAGAIHCIVMQVPRYIDQTPSAHIIYPDGGEIFVGGSTKTITWAATDTYNQDIPNFELYYSLDNGNTFTFIDSTSNVGWYDWTVPDNTYSSEAIIKIVAIANDNDEAVVVSNQSFIIASGNQTVYDFSENAGIDRFGYGSSTGSWLNDVDGQRMPVSTEIDSIVSNAYERLAYPDATGGDTDPNRYISTNPSYFSESTHVFEFEIAEDESMIDLLEIYVEGYADSCSQIELYIWDDNQQKWADGQGFFGQNRFTDNWAGNHDGFLTVEITDDIEVYLDPDGKITLLTYVERGGDQSFIDYLSIIVSSIQTEPLLSYAPHGYDFQAVYVNETISTTFDIWNSGSGTIEYLLSESCPWVDLNTLQGNSSGEHDTITVTVNTTDLTPDEYNCNITINSNAGNGTFQVSVTVVEEGTPLVEINQSVFNRGFPIRTAIDGDWAGAQDFTSENTVLSSVSLYIRKFGSPEFDLTVELRENGVQGTLLDVITIPAGDVSLSWTWISFDFNDVAVNPTSSYFIVIPPAPSGVTTSFGYEWGYAFGNQYDDGSFWFTRDGGNLWRDLPTMYEFTFRTYGY